MKIKQVRISASRTINLGDFNSLKIEGECVVQMPSEGVYSSSDARQLAIKEVKEQLKEAYTAFKPAKK